jgi:hypothetical protein
MADKNLQNTSQVINDSFIKGLNKDSDPSYVTEGMWTHAINMVNNSMTGKVGSISNETANYICFNAGTYMPAIATDKNVIGAIYLFSDKWVIFTAGHNDLGQPVSSEIGLFEEEQCLYRPIVIDACLNFDKRFLISGASRIQADCSWQVYWADGTNPDRYLNIGDPNTWPPNDYIFGGSSGAIANYYSKDGNKILWPGVKWIEECRDDNKKIVPSPGYTPVGCITCIDTNALDCDKIRLARLMETPVLTMSLGQSGGTMLNGTYFAIICYLINGQKVTDYFSQSNYQFVYSPQDLQSSISISIQADSVNFDEFQLVIVSCTNQQTVAKIIGNYSTSTNVITLDQIDPTLISVPLEQLPIQTPVFETSDQMTEMNNYLLRVGPRSKFDFNYQPLANLIQTKWASVEYPADYYMKGGNKTNYMRDETYAFFIRWVYDTGDKSASYHIPGRAPMNFQIPGGNIVSEIEHVNDKNGLTTDEKVFEVYNTATLETTSNTVLPDGGILIASGKMGYWESSEKYPSNKPEVWNSSSHCWTTYQAQVQPPNKTGKFDLCGKNIRHHKFPEDFINNATTSNAVRFDINNTNSNQNKIRILGVYFENIVLPKDNDGIDIPGIVGFEILRGSREGNKTIVAKGMVNNFRSYKLLGTLQNQATGLYANYPFNCITPPSSNWGGNVQGQSDPYIHAEAKQFVPDDIFSFHSPDTMFRTPFLSTPEFKLYGSLSGVANQQFNLPNGHPKFKLLDDVAINVLVLAGLAEGIVSMIGKRTQSAPQPLNMADSSDLAGVSAVARSAYNIAVAGANTAQQIFLEGYYGTIGPITDAITASVGGFNATTLGVAEKVYIGILNTVAVASVGGGSGTFSTYSIELPDYAYLPVGIRTIGALNYMLNYFSQGADVALQIMYATTSYRQFALQSMAYGFYNNMAPRDINQISRFRIQDSFYLKDNIQEVSTYQNNQTGANVSYSINNLKRPASVTLRTVTGPYVDPLYPDGVNNGPSLLTQDNSLVTLASAIRWVVPVGSPLKFDEPTASFNTNIESHYGALKSRVRNQYGQIDAIKQISITNSEEKLSDYKILPTNYACNNVLYKCYYIQTTPVFFGGDTYINRYTEKNNMLFFYDWLYNQPDGFEFNYYLRNMIPSPRFSVNSTAYNIQNLTSAMSFSNPGVPGGGALPSSAYVLDAAKYDYENDDPDGYDGFFFVKNAYFYLANSSIRDFFVESDVLVDFREQPIDVGRKHYDPYRYTNYQAMFDINPQIMGVNSSYQYDYSLSVSKLYNQYFSGGNLQNRYYNPLVSQLCYTYYPDRIIYSLPQQNEMIRDSWFIYLANNYNQFKSQISGVKSINKSGIVITFNNDSPIMYQGVDTLQTDLGTKITIGDGGLFSQPAQQLTNAEKAYEYGASQNRLSVISTPVGIYYMSASSGKIFALGNGLQEISQQGMKWWFTLFLPYKLTQDFPNYPYQDNPVAGIGCQSVYDNTNGILYFSKKDYQLKDEFTDRVTYVGLKTNKQGDYFILDGNDAIQYRLGDDYLFDDASWTISYDPKNQFWISFHDWHPDLFMPTKDVFISTKGTGGWRHNWICNSYCNYYGIDYACEIDMPITTGQTVTTTRSIEYIMEAYRKNHNNCVDSHHVLDFNFDKAVFYNSEQVSGYLNLNLYPKNNLILAREFPKLNGNLQSFDILFTKEENKYRFNQFWDVTKNRGEFPIGSNYPPTGPLTPNSTTLLGTYDNQNMWLTEPDGYTRVLNPNNLDYDKPQMQRKKFRHYMNFLNLKRTYSGDVNIVLKINNAKLEISQR